MGAEFSMAVIGEQVDEFIKLCLVKDDDTPSPECPADDGGVEDVDCQFRDRAFGGIIEPNKIGSAMGRRRIFLQSNVQKSVHEGGRDHDVTDFEDRA